jgi:L-alanine-DL-glutamate epimerase-like enolase superfamily enzyme
MGFKQFKLKVTGTDDLAKVRAVRRIIGPSSDLRVDANGAWNVGQAITMARKLLEFGVSSVEQPIPAGDPVALAEVQRKGGLPVMADESLCTRADARAIAAARAADLWNIRLAKVGGFSGVLEMVRMAKENGIRIHLGVLVGETSLLAAAGRACAGLADYAHVEFGFASLLLRADPFRGGPMGFFAIGKPLGRKPGLGVEPVQRLLNRVTLKHDTVD